MSVFDLASLASASPTLMREFIPQMQRKCPILRVLPCKPVVTGQNIGWDVSFDGQVAAAVNIDGGALLTAAADPRVAAKLDYGSYSAPVQVTTKAQWALSAQNSAEFLKNLVDQNVGEAVMKLVKQLNVDIYAGSGSGNNQLNGLNLAVANSGSYANINSATYSNWKSYSAGNSGSLRSLTLALIKTAASTIAKNSSFGRPDFAFLPPALFDALENLFDSYTHSYYNPMSGDVATTMLDGRKQTLSMNPAMVQTAGGQIKRTGFRALVWENQGITFIEDPDCANSALTNTANCIFFLTSGAVELQYLPPADISNYMPDQKVIDAMEQDLGPIGGLKMDFRARGRQKFADEADISCALNLVVKNRAATGILFDVQ